MRARLCRHIDSGCSPQLDLRHREQAHVEGLDAARGEEARHARADGMVRTLTTHRAQRGEEVLGGRECARTGRHRTVEYRARLSGSTTTTRPRLAVTRAISRTATAASGTCCRCGHAVGGVEGAIDEGQADDVGHRESHALVVAGRLVPGGRDAIGLDVDADEAQLRHLQPGRS